jgi:hypothetical protein
MLKKLLYVVSAAVAGVATGILASAQPAAAYPTCEQEVRIRCAGYGLNGKPPLDIYYDSYEECVEQETQFRCGIDPFGDPLASLQGRAEVTIGRVVKATQA